MPRAPRVYFPGAVFHIIQRGNNQQEIFLDDKDYWHYLKLLLEAKKEFGVLVYGYVLMPNHIHLILETPNENPISEIMKFIGGSYAIYFNKKYNRVGHLFQGRFKSILVEKESYLLELSRYLHLNPVKAGLAKSPEAYKWTSFNIYTGEKRDLLVDTNFILDLFNFKDEEEKRVAYKLFVLEGIKELDRKEDWLKKHLKYQRFLATASFIEKIKRGLTPFNDPF
ncbi:MAG: transposase [Candidatus Omnitrophica bacterium]|nr:transposase [Candidatus Omnitrophota bacterium]